MNKNGFFEKIVMLRTSWIPFDCAPQILARLTHKWVSSFVFPKIHKKYICNMLLKQKLRDFLYFFWELEFWPAIILLYYYHYYSYVNRCKYHKPAPHFKKPGRTWTTATFHCYLLSPFVTGMFFLPCCRLTECNFYCTSNAFIWSALVAALVL